MTWLHRHKQLVLASMLGCLYIVQSTSHGLLGARALSNVFVGLIVLAVLLAVFEHHRSRIVAVILAAVTLVTNVVHYAQPAAELEIPLSVAHYMLVTLFLGYSVVVILGNLFRKGTVGADDVLGAVNGYLIAGAAWSSLYALTSTLVPEAFTLPPAFASQVSDWPGRSSVFNYFSIVTLTTVGYGDITPARAPATTLTMMEAVFGQFYIAVVVAQLIGARLSNPVRQEAGDP